MQRATSYKSEREMNIKGNNRIRHHKKKANVERLHIKHNPDFLLVSCVFTLLLLGAIMVYSASWPESLKLTGSADRMAFNQIVAMGLGIVFMIGTYYLPVRVYKKAYVILFATAILINLLTKTPLGVEKFGARRWIDLGIIDFMPSDIMKIAGVIMMSAFLSKNKNCIKSLDSTIKMGLIIIIAGGVVFLQDDLGTTAVIITALAVLSFLGGLHGLATVIGGFSVIGFTFLAAKLEPYRFKRLAVFMNPFEDRLGSGLQAVRSLYALGSGGLGGQGLGRSVQKYSYLPFSYNDFIFSIMGEELGFVGAGLYLCVLFIFISRGLIMASKVRDDFSKYLATGIILMIAIQSLVHIGVALSLLPTKGIGLPFISQGGTSLVLFMAMVGILLQISRTADWRKKEKDEINN